MNSKREKEPAMRVTTDNPAPERLTDERLEKLAFEPNSACCFEIKMLIARVRELEAKLREARNCLNDTTNFPGSTCSWKEQVLEIDAVLKGATP